MYNKDKIREREVIKMIIKEKQAVNITIELDKNEIISLNDVYAKTWSLIDILDRNEAEQFVSQITGKIISKNDLMHVVDVIDNLNHRNWVLE